MKKFLKVLFVVLLLAFALTGCVAQGFVSLPDDVVTGINVVILFGVSFAIAYLIALVPFLAFLDQFRLPLAAAIATQLIDVLQNAVPDQYGILAIHVLRAVLALLALLGVGFQLKRKGVI